MHQNRLGSGWLGSSFAEKGPLASCGKQVDHEQCAFVAKANCILGCISESVTNRSRVVILLLYSAFVRSRLGSVVQERHWYRGASLVAAAKLVRGLECKPCK